MTLNPEHIFSCVLVIMRTFVVSLLASRVNDESKIPTQILHSVPSTLWSKETKRFRDEVVNNTVALSGLKFFFLTRKLILSVAGTIVLEFHTISRYQST